MNHTKHNHRKEADLFLVIAIIAVALIIYACVRLLSPAGAVAVVSVDGQETARFPLNEERTVRIEGVGGFNELCIREGAVFITDADCPDRLCQSQGQIRNGGESIICLPHRVVIRIEGNGTAPDESEVDTIAR